MIIYIVEGINMQRSKTANYIIIGIIFLYTLLSVRYMYSGFVTYLYFVNPIFWLSLCVALSLGIKLLYSKKIQTEVVQYTSIAVLYYIIIYMVAGAFLGFVTNQMNTTATGFAHNFWMYGTVIIAREIIRFKVINNSFDKDKVKIGILLIIAFSLFEILTQIVNTALIKITPYYIVKQLYTQILPIIIKNILFTYIAANSSYISAILYELAIKTFFWVSPILTDAPWILSATIDAVVPIILLLYIMYTKNKKDVFVKEKKVIYIDPKSMVPMTILAIVIVWFTAGIFPIKPVAIATGSMIPNINIGDVVITKKVGPDKIQLNDIIEYKYDNVSVVHRVVQINRENDILVFTTKGDSNSSKDRDPVLEDDVIGKVILRIPLVGYPAVLLTNLR